MHRSIRESLEDCLGDKEIHGGDRAVQAHLASCPECRRSVQLMRRQAGLLRSLRPSEQLDPAPGFYARVIDRIESERVASIWSVFLEPVFARRLAYVSLAMLLVLGTLFATGGARPDAIRALYEAPPEAIFAEKPVYPAIGEDLERDRDVVLVNLATYQF